MSAFSDLRKKLAELFQLDAAAELDFGIYRILNARRVEIEGFLDSLEPQVEAILAEALQSGGADLKAELEKVEAGLRAGGFDDAMIATAPKARELREKIAESGDDPAAITHEIFSLLTTFFSRYYKDGDFISLRRYKKDTYAIPYEGEEVKLHWANADQYYIKSSESFRDYTFKLGPAPKDDKPDQRPAVTFKLVEADIEKDNNKAVAGQERRFVYQGVVPSSLPENSKLDTENLILGFTYAPVGKKEKQADLNAAAAEQILADHAKGAFTALAANDPTYTVKGKTRTFLAKHLAEYTGKNSFDYFIHKDLGGFLRRELDFFIKNEVVHLDDLDEAPETHWREVRAKLKALRQIAGKIIRFLAQIEDFQKKLWVKKKFVTACDYVVTLDRIPEELYPEIAACDAQREEWVRLFAIDEITGDLGRAGYSVPLTVEFLKENRCLPLDSQNLSTGAKQNLSSVVYEVDGLAWNSENFQAPNLLNRRYRGDVSMIYADPPYNTGSDGFAYKDNFQHSSWLSMLSQRLPILRQLLAGDSALFLSLDDAELYRAICLLEQAFSGDGHLATFARRTKSGGGSAADAFAVEHDYVVAWAKNKSSCRKFFINHDPEYLKRYSESDEDGPYFWDTMERSSTATKPYPIEAPDGTILRGKWFRSEDRFKSDLLKGDARIVKVAGEKWSVQFKQRLAPGRKLRSLMAESEFRSQPKDLGDLGLGDSFPYPKTLFLLEKIIECATFSASKRGSILDPFAGSGTTGHAVINLNREDGGDRKYILIEMGEHFDSVLVPRLKKVIYSKDWKDGKPQSRNTGISHCFKILRLESYEDTLNNLRLHRSREQELALETFSPQAKEDYQLGYMLDLEAKGSQSLLNVSAFIDPWNYTLEIASGTAGETKTTRVDLVETFHWLLGLTVLAQGRGEGVHWTEGTNPEGEKVLVLWRNTTEVDAEALNAWCRKQKISVLDGEFSLIYVNGDHHLENLRRDDQTWKVRLIDEEFPKLMWEGCE